MVGGDSLVYLTLLLRLAVLVHHSRSKHESLPIQLLAKDNHTWHIAVNMADDNAKVVLSDLQDEIDIWQKWGINLVVDTYEASA